MIEPVDEREPVELDLADYECDLAMEDERGRDKGRMVVMVPKFTREQAEAERDEAKRERHNFRHERNFLKSQETRLTARALAAEREVERLRGVLRAAIGELGRAAETENKELIAEYARDFVEAARAALADNPEQTMAKRKIMALEKVRPKDLRIGDTIYDNNGTFREIDGFPPDWVHEPSGESGPTISMRLGVSAHIHLTCARTSMLLRVPALADNRTGGTDE